MPRTRISAKVETIQPKWINKEEAMRYLGKSEKFLKTLRDEAEVSFSQYRNEIWYEVKSLDKFLERHKVI